MRNRTQLLFDALSIADECSKPLSDPILRQGAIGSEVEQVVLLRGEISQPPLQLLPEQELRALFVSQYSFEY